MVDKNEWGSNLSFILAMIGSAVGLGNIWRYPYVLYSNGGGAFYIPYIVAILIRGAVLLLHGDLVNFCIYFMSKNFCFENLLNKLF